MNRKYLFFDIDGTLVAGGYEHAYIPESTKAAIEQLRAAGHFLCISTGRSQAMGLGFMEELGFENMISDGGYGITLGGKILGITSLPPDKVREAIREAESLGFPWGVQIDNTTSRQVPDERFYEFTHDTYMGTTVVPGLNIDDYDTFYKAYIACYYPDEYKMKTLKDLPWGRFHKEYFFIEPSDKGYGVKKIMGHFNAPYKDAIVFGDAANDLSMFCPEWTKVAMGNAIPELKEKADFVTTNVDQDGIWNACVRLGLVK